MKQHVRMGKLVSDPRTISTGSPQGCVLSHLLFSLYTNCCSSSHESVKLLTFGDDSTLIGLISDGDESACRWEIDHLVTWCNQHNLEFSAVKTVKMGIDLRKNPAPPAPIILCNSSVETVDSVRFLGTIITQDLKWEFNTSALIKKAQQRMYFLGQLNKFNLPKTTMRRKIVEQYQKGVSQRKIAKSLKLSSYTVHNIIQRFRESRTISVRKGQGRKTILDARDLRALRRHCITYRNATVMEITTWAQEYFQKTLSVNTIHRAIRRCRLKLYRSKKKPYLNMIQKRRHFLWAKAHLKWTVAKWKTVLWSDESKFEVLFGKLGRHVIRTKEDKDNPSCYQRSVQKPASLMEWGCMSACGMGSLHIWKGTINAERYIQVLEQLMLPSRRRLFQGRPCIF